MAKKQILDDDLDEVSEEVEVFNYNNCAFGMVQVGEKEYQLFQVLVNTNTLKSDKVELFPTKYDTSMRAEYELTKMFQTDIMKRINKKRKDALKGKK